MCGPVKSDLVSGFRSVFVAVVLLILFQLPLCLLVFLSATVAGVVSVSSWKSCFCCLFCFLPVFLFLFIDMILLSCLMSAHCRSVLVIQTFTSLQFMDKKHNLVTPPHSPR